MTVRIVPKPESSMLVFLTETRRCMSTTTSDDATHTLNYEAVADKRLSLLNSRKEPNRRA